MGMDDLLALDLGSGTAQQTEVGTQIQGQGVLLEKTFAQEAKDAGAQSALNNTLFDTSTASAVITTESDEKTLKAYRTLCVKNDGVLYEDSVLQLGIKSQWTPGKGRLAIYHGNKTSAPLSHYSVDIEDESGGGEMLFSLNALALPSDELAPGKQTIQLCNDIACKAPKRSTLRLVVRYRSAEGKNVTLRLSLPLHALKFCEPLLLDAASFFAAWKAISGEPREFQKVIQVQPNVANDGELIASVVRALRLSVLSGIDPLPSNLVAAGNFVAAASGIKAPVLLRIETNAAAQAMRVSVRTQNAALTASVAEAVVAQFEK